MKIRNCENCGADIGYEEDKRAGDPMVTCSARACIREANYQAAIEYDERMEAAREDDYGRY